MKRAPKIGSHHGDRHLVYLSRDYAVDVRLELQEHDSDILRGELLRRGDGPVAEVPTFLLAGDEIAGYDRTGSLGEFSIEAEGAMHLRLCLLLDAERCIDLPIDLTPVRQPIDEAGSRLFFDSAISKPTPAHTNRDRGDHSRKICHE